MNNKLFYKLKPLLEEKYPSDTPVPKGCMFLNKRLVIESDLFVWCYRLECLQKCKLKDRTLEAMLEVCL